MNTVGVVGLGQIGGSIARGLALRGVSVTGTDTDPYALESAKRSGINIVADLRAVVASSSVIFVCVSLDANKRVLQEIIEAAGECDAAPTITDVASYKKGTSFRPDGYVGLIPGHPMAGTHGHGFNSSNPDLFVQAQWILTADDVIENDRIVPLIRIITSLGARVQLCSSAWHDEAVSMISALPHVLAIALGKVSVESDDCESKLSLAAGSFRSATRVLQSNPRFIQELLFFNTDTLLPLIPSVVDVLQNIAHALRSGDRKHLAALIEDARHSAVYIEGKEVFSVPQEVRLTEVNLFLQSLVNTGHSISKVEENSDSIRFGLEYLHTKSFDH